jgi:hypothetical protein
MILNLRWGTPRKHKKLMKKRLTRTKKSLNTKKHEINEYKVTRDMRNAVKLNAQPFKPEQPKTAQRVLKHST